jgi:hypothetical protein
MVSMPLDWSELTASPERWTLTTRSRRLNVFERTGGPSIGPVAKKFPTHRLPRCKPSEAEPQRRVLRANTHVTAGSQSWTISALSSRPSIPYEWLSFGISSRCPISRGSDSDAYPNVLTFWGPCYCARHLYTPRR